jgi:hypothetical protein
VHRIVSTIKRQSDVSIGCLALVPGRRRKAPREHLSPTTPSVLSRQHAMHPGSTVGYRLTMPENPTQAVDLSWFCTLNLDDRVNLLNNPRQSLISQFVERILAQVRYHEIKQAVIDETLWSGTATWRLDELMTAKLEEDSQKLDRWFDSLTPAERNHVIAHRRDEGTQAASTASDVDPRMAHPYLDMKATKLGRP